MSDIFKRYLHEKVAVTETALERISSLSIPTKLRRGEHLLKEGEVWRYRAFISKGLLRTYRTDDTGQIHVLRFAIENWWAGDSESYFSGKPSVCSIDALEPSEILLWKKDDFETLSNEIPALKEMRDKLVTRNLIATQNRLFFDNSHTAEEKYRNFLESYPEIARRVPLHMIASYLGVTRETLTRIRRQAAKRR